MAWPSMCGWTWNPSFAASAARSTIRAIMSGDKGPPRSETKTNGDVLTAFSLRSADTSSLSSVCTLSIDPFSRRTWKVFAPDPGVTSKSVHLVCLASDARRPFRYINRSRTWSRRRCRPSLPAASITALASLGLR